MSAATFRFRPASRLLNGKEYTAVFANRRVLRGGPFELYYRPISEVSAMSALKADTTSVHPRLGLVMPKRNAKRAVHRNLIKRLVREAFRHVCGQLPPYDLVLRLGRPLNAQTISLDRQRKEWRTQIDALFLRLPPFQQ